MSFTPNPTFDDAVGLRDRYFRWSDKARLQQAEANEKAARVAVFDDNLQNPVLLRELAEAIESVRNEKSWFSQYQHWQGVIDSDEYRQYMVAKQEDEMRIKETPTQEQLGAIWDALEAKPKLSMDRDLKRGLPVSLPLTIYGVYTCNSGDLNSDEDFRAFAIPNHRAKVCVLAHVGEKVYVMSEVGLRYVMVESLFEMGL